MHGKCFMDAKAELEAQKECDPGMKKAKTIKARDNFKALHLVDRYSVMNRRTAWVASTEWLNKNVKLSADGRPIPKNEKGKLWILTVRIQVVKGHVQLHLQPADGKAFRPLRCYSLTDGHPKTKLSSLVAGYEHVLQDQEEELEPCLFLFFNTSLTD